MNKCIITSAEALKIDEDTQKILLGGKATNLIKLAGLEQLKVPAFLIISSVALKELAVAGEHRQNQFAVNLKQSVKALSAEGTLFAVRSSASCEDSLKASFAGQFQSRLNVSIEELPAAVTAVYKSLESPAITAYAQIHGVAVDSMAVIVQEMVPADISGVIFSFDPTKGLRKNDSILLTMTGGLADKLVSGAVDAETVSLSRTGRVQSVVCDQGLMEQLSEPSLAKLLSNLRQVEDCFKAPQDIEWAMSKGQIYILQARPITSHFAQATVFDGSNIQESYPGSTSLLTYSFARRVYSGVYKSFMRFMGVSEAVVKDKTEVFENLLAYKNSHIYYNLNNWYSLIALLPNYRQTRHFMEKMMGLESPCELDLDSFAHNEISRFGLLNSGIALTVNYLKMEKHSKQFFKQAAQLQARARHLEQLSYAELVKFYLELEKELLDQWQAPIANDFFAMVFYGLLAGQYGKQAPEAGSHYLYNLLLRDHGGISSAEPPRLLKEIAKNLHDALLAEKFVEAVRESRRSEAIALVCSSRLGQDNWSILLERFGDRSIGELKLETKTYRQDPGLLLKILASLVDSSCEFPSCPGGSLAGVASADSELDHALHHSLKNPLLAWLGTQARVFLARRENMRLVRSQVFGIVRAIVCALGRHLERQGIIDNADDVFYFEISELLNLPSFDSLGYWNQVVALRKSWAQELPEESPRRLVQYGLRPPLAVFEADVQSLDATSIVGLGASVGKVRGIARVISEPEEETMAGYDILVAKRTDPGWIVHFAMCKGIVTTHGSLLSHTAIVAREMQIPAVVSAPGATNLITTGDLIEIDGSSGAVTIIAKANLTPLKITA